MTFQNDAPAFYDALDRLEVSGIFGTKSFTGNREVEEGEGLALVGVGDVPFVSVTEAEGGL